MSLAGELTQKAPYDKIVNNKYAENINEWYGESLKIFLYLKMVLRLLYAIFLIWY